GGGITDRLGKSAPAQDDEQPGDNRRGRQISGRNDRFVPPERLESRIEKGDPGRFLIPHVTVEHVSVQDPPAFVAVQPLIAARRRGEVWNSEREKTGEEKQPHQREARRSVARRILSRPLHSSSGAGAPPMTTRSPGG